MFYIKRDLNKQHVLIKRYAPLCLPPRGEVKTTNVFWKEPDGSNSGISVTISALCHISSTQSVAYDGRGTLHRQNFDRPGRCPKLFACFETLADSKTYRGFAPASPNLFCPWQKRVLIKITLSHQTKNQPFWVGHCLVGEGGFEPPKAKPADLQSVPFGHLGTLPHSIR